MRALCCAAILVFAFTPGLRADTHRVIKTTISGHEMVFSEYLQGMNMRTEVLSGEGAARRVTIHNSERKAMYQLDLQSREYVEWRAQGPDLILSLAQWIARPPRTRESGKVVNIYYETIDTGEQKQFFEHPAKHLVRRERHVAEPGACDQTHQIEKDGWYIPLAEPGTEKASYRLASYINVIGSNACHDTVLRHGDPSPPGELVFETDGPVTRELLGLSNDHLGKSLFEVPSGFRKVDALPGSRAMSWSQQLAMEWAQLERAFESWFE